MISLCTFDYPTENHSELTHIICSWDALPDPDITPPKTEKGLSGLFVEIRSTVGQEAQIVQAVFPNPPFVMQVFLQRVFAQSVNRFAISYAYLTQINI